MKAPNRLYVNLKQATKILSIETSEPESTYKSYTSKKEGYTEYVHVDDYNLLVKKNNKKK